MNLCLAFSGCVSLIDCLVFCLVVVAGVLSVAGFLQWFFRLYLR
jgi:hypothetical protein